MSEFGFWQRWGLELDDRQFANAFLVLGVLAAQYFVKDRSELQDVLLAALRRAQEKDKLLPWRFANRDQPAQVGNDRRVVLSDLNPWQVARAWTDIVDGTPLRPAFRSSAIP